LEIALKLQHVVAIGLVIALAVWMMIPRDRTSPADQYESVHAYAVVRAVPADSVTGNDAGTFTVRTTPVSVQNYVERVRVRGVTQATRLVNVRAETSGKVIATPVARGARVRQGDLLCELAVDSREADLQEARSREEQAKIEYEGALDLQTRGLTSRASIAQLKAALDSSIAATQRAELALKRTRIVAPFGGIMESRAVEVGDLMDNGGSCGTLLDDTPMLLTGEMSEQDVARVLPGTDVAATLVTGESVQGKLTYISRAADPASRSYRIEVELAPTEFPIRHGLTAEIYIAGEEIQAHLILPSALTLNDAGATGVKLVGSDNVVQFAEVNIVGESTGMNPGFWVTGLPARASVITLGQEIVFAGQRVETARPDSGGN
jgi:membrane fusion protein, multidrug efflux system